MKAFLFLCPLFLASCATQYLVPGNRFITPETQGGVFRGQVEVQKTSATQLTVKSENGSVNEGVRYSSIARTGYLASNSLFNSFDLIWSHTGSANSMLGGKYQFLGDPRSQKGTGHRAAITALFGANDHRTEGRSNVDFELGGSEYIFLYGYRITEAILTYSSLSLANYSFKGKVNSSDPTIDGLRPKEQTNASTASLGFEFSSASFFGKLEASYQQLRTTDTKKKDNGIFGYAFGFSW